jgi:hypothetical protein
VSLRSKQEGTFLVRKLKRAVFCSRLFRPPPQASTLLRPPSGSEIPAIAGTSDPEKQEFKAGSFWVGSPCDGMDIRPGTGGDRGWGLTRNRGGDRGWGLTRNNRGGDRGCGLTRNRGWWGVRVRPGRSSAWGSGSDLPVMEGASDPERKGRGGAGLVWGLSRGGTGVWRVSMGSVTLRRGGINILD